MADVTLTSSMRANLLTLQNTQTLFDKTSERLATGKAVNSVLDDAVKFFTADALNQRASLLEDRKADIGNAVQSVTAATDGITAIKTSIQQLKSLISQARSALGSTSGDTTRESVAKQYNEVLDQIDNYVKDASYNGVNFLQTDPVDGPTELTVYFNEESTTSLTIEGFDASASGLGIRGTFTPTATVASGADQTVQLTTVDSVTTQDGGLAADKTIAQLGGYTITATNMDGANSTNVTVTDAEGNEVASIQTPILGPSTTAIATGDGVIGITVNSDDSYSIVYSDDGFAADAEGEITIASDGSSDDITTVTVFSSGGNDVYSLTTDGTTNGTAAAAPIVQAFNGSPLVADSFDEAGELQDLEDGLNAALATLQAESSKLSGNVSILQTRDNFIKELSNTLTTGADKLTLADINEEGANLLALQTQQQLGITSLSLASQAQQGVLRLF